MDIMHHYQNITIIIISLFSWKKTTFRTLQYIHTAKLRFAAKHSCRVIIIIITEKNV